MNRSISASAPAKLILFGEWAVLRGHTCLGLPLNGTFTTHATSSSTNRITSLNHDFEASNNLLENNSWVQRVWSELVRSLSVSEPFHYECERSWPLHEGMGSSSALFLTLVEIRETLLNKKLSWLELKKIFSSISENRGSGMDLAIQRTRSAIVYEDFLPRQIPNFAWPKNLILLHGTQKQNTCQAIQTISCSDQQASGIAKSAKRFSLSQMTNKDWIQAIQEHYEILKDMNVIPKEAFLLWSELKKSAGVEAIKSVGAGGMDGLLLWVDNPETFDKFTPVLRNLGWYLSPHKAMP